MSAIADQGAQRTITIVGGGQGGLMLAIGLRREGYGVRLVQDRPASAIADGVVMSSQCMFATARRLEQELGLDLWTDQAPPIEKVRIEALALPGETAPIASFTGQLAAPAASVDQRLKMPAWLGLFEALGGILDIEIADIDLLERYARECELVIVAAGKGAFSDLFMLDRQWSPFDRPMRSLAMTYVSGADAPAERHCISSTAVPGAGGIMAFPALARHGPCEIMLFEGLIGGPLDVARPGMTTEELWSAMLSAFTRVLPGHAERLKSAHPTDDKAGLSGRVTPAVRHAVGHLPSGRPVLGLGDAIVLNDPLVGQGANNAAKTATLYLHAIRQRGMQPFDEPWLNELAGLAWQRVKAATVWTNMSLQPPTRRMARFLQRATVDQMAADWFVRGFDEPATIAQLLSDRDIG